MLVKNFPYRQFEFAEFNKVQKAVIPHIDKDVNIVLASKTATGKTVIAEAAFAYHLQNNDQGKCVYASPLRALSNEKYESWIRDRQFSAYPVLLSTGDCSASEEELEQARMVLLTTESFDSRTRSSAHKSWISKISCLVIDEAHIMGDTERGSCVESCIMRFTKINPNARIIFLSATMSNAKQLAEWIKSLNGKETINVCSNWRPKKLTTKMVIYEGSERNNWKKRLDLTMSRIKKAEPQEKIIVFVQSKKFGKELSKLLMKNGIMCSFHNASISKNNRKKIEKLFKDQNGGMNVLISTSTLSAGVNIG